MTQWTLEPETNPQLLRSDLMFYIVSKQSPHTKEAITIVVKKKHLKM